jgi:hypothetical protein
VLTGSSDLKRGRGVIAREGDGVEFTRQKPEASLSAPVAITDAEMSR